MTGLGDEFKTGDAAPVAVEMIKFLWPPVNVRIVVVVVGVVGVVAGVAIAGADRLVVL